MIKYAFKERPLALRKADKADPQKIGDALEKIRTAQAGHLKPDHVWQAAEGNPRHPLHKHFEWDERTAAEAHWRETARVLIRCITVEDDGEDKPAYFSVSEKAGTSYRSYGDVMASADLQMAVLRAAERDLKAFETRYRQLEEVCSIVAEARAKVSARLVAA